MRNVTITSIAMALALSGCASSTMRGGNHIRTAAVNQQALAFEAVDVIARLWPAATTQLDLTQPTNDPFGAALAQGLRERGYALLELPAAHADRAHPEVRSFTGLPLSYMVNEYGSPPTYWMTLYVGGQSISRLYSIGHAGAPSPVGYWSRKGM